MNAASPAAPRPGRTWLFASFRAYRPSWIVSDLMAGLMLGAISIPEQLATARLAGLSPHTGLYALGAGSLAFAVLGANRFVSVGADSTIAPIFAGALAALAATGSPQYANLAAVLAMMVGAILITSAVLRAGWIADLLSIPVITGFLAGISVHIIVNELPSVLGIARLSGPLIVRMVKVARHLPDANPYAVAIGVGMLVVTLVSERIGPRVPGALIGLTGAAIAVAGLNLKAHGVAVLHPLPQGLPALTVPNLSWPVLQSLLPAALVVAAVCMMQTAAVVRSFPSDPGQLEDISHDFAGVGAGCVLAGFIGAFAVDSSPPCTAVVKHSGGHSQLAALTQVALTVALVVFAPGLTAYIPSAALGGLLIFIGMRIFRVSEMARIARRGGYEILLVAVSAALVVLMPIQTGMLLAIVISLLHSIYIVARPRCGALVRVPGTTIWWPPDATQSGERLRGVVVFSAAAPIYFTNAGYFAEKLQDAVAAAEQPVRLVVIEASGMIDIDYTGSQVLQAAIADLRARGVDVAVARLSAERAESQARRTGLIAALGADHVFKSAEEAVRARGIDPPH